VHGGAGDPKVRCDSYQGLAARPHLAQLHDSLGRHRGVPVVFSSGHVLGMLSCWVVLSSCQPLGMSPGPVLVTERRAPLPGCVPIVVSRSTRPEVRRVATWRVIAAMAHTEPDRDLSGAQVVRYTVRPDHAAVEAEVAIAGIPYPTDPGPAGVGAAAPVHPGPEPCFFLWREGNLSGSHLAPPSQVRLVRAAPGCSRGAARLLNNRTISVRGQG
jgi:hypothetical protein